VNTATQTKAAPSKDPRHVITPKARLNFAYLFHPRPPMNGQAGDPSYSCVLTFDPGTDLSPMKMAAFAAAKEKWADKARTMSLRSPFRNNSDREGQEGFPPGGVFVTCRSNNRPGVVDQAVQPILSTDAIYSGCWVRASLRAFAYENAGNRGVSFALLNVQKISDGDRLDNRRSAEQDFEPLPGAEGPFADGAAGDSDIPF